jgi:hypothetical protein
MHVFWVIDSYSCRTVRSDTWHMSLIRPRPPPDRSRQSGGRVQPRSNLCYSAISFAISMCSIVRTPNAKPQVTSRHVASTIRFTPSSRTAPRSSVGDAPRPGSLIPPARYRPTRSARLHRPYVGSPSDPFSIPLPLLQHQHQHREDASGRRRLLTKNVWTR